MVNSDAVDSARFEVTGGALCLDFANTVDNRPTERTDGLRTYEDLVAWTQQTGALTEEHGEALRLESARRPAAAAAALSVARELREALYAIFAAAARHAPAPADALAMLNAALPPALARREVRPAGEGYAWSWKRSTDQLDDVLAPVVESAATLLTSPDLLRVRECEAETCGWLFLDRSRNRSRRWCDMKVCGNRAKVRRHYQRTRGKSEV